jgi:eukaryotic-like serine/threonine-protein kinase
MAVTRTQFCPECKHPLPEGDSFCPACAFQGALSLSARRAETRIESGATTITINSAYVSSRERVGERIDRYRLVEQIGEGGIGSVYVAEQVAPIKRMVALKIIKLGMDTRQVIGRFEAERQTLALMDHPNIAKLLDAGATDRGRPYFVMELVRGIKITDYSDQNNLSTEERIKLFIQVCAAVEHAHQKGIIHRDIKPSNILVTHQNGVPVPKVLDFGIAKATDNQRLSDETVYTAIEQFIGTPAYMSPEQAGMSGLDIDTRSDIYALGVLLYELLTGTTPLDGRRLLESGFDEIRHVIREEDPPRPSARLSTLPVSEQISAATHRHCDPPKLIRQVRGDLDWIVMKCLEKDRTRRYETASGLGRDLERYLDNEQILARPPSTAYRLKKVLQRNKLLFTAASAIALALVLGGVGTTVSLERAEKQRQLKEAAQQEASKLSEDVARSLETERKAKLSASFWQDTMHDVRPSVALGRDTTLLRETLARAVKRLELTLKDQPAIQAELSDAIGDIYTEIGDSSEAEALHNKAREFRKSVEKSTRP